MQSWPRPADPFERRALLPAPFRGLGASACPDQAFGWVTGVTEGINEGVFAGSNFPWRRPMGFGEFSREVQLMKDGGARARASCKRAIHQRFKLTEAGQSSVWSTSPHFHQVRQYRALQSRLRSCGCIHEGDEGEP